MLIAAVLISRLGFSATGTITVDASIQHQVMRGWEGTATVGEVDFLDDFEMWRDTAIDLCVNELGIDRVRLPARAGTENPVDYFSQYLAGQITRAEWKTHWDEAINDNSDAHQISPSGFQFAWVDFIVEQIIDPMRQRLVEKGEKLHINLLYFPGRAATGGPGLLHSENAEEYAELMLAHFQHLQFKYGWVPDQVEIANEPMDNGWSAREVGEALVATAERLKAAGFEPDFAAPSNLNTSDAIIWFDQMIEQVPQVLEYLDEFAYHRYGGDTAENLQAIGARTLEHGVYSAMTERMDAGYTQLHQDLSFSRASAWHQLALAYPGTENSGGSYYFVDRTDPANPTVSITSRSKFLRQYFKFIRAGAQRIEASSNQAALDPLAFINTDGTHVVVVKAAAAASLTIQGLPAGTYRITYTTASEYDVDLPEVTLSTGQTITTSIPATGVMTVYSSLEQSEDQVLDIDGNGASDALTDGLLVLRFLFGFRGDPLISGAVAVDATRDTAESIAAYLTANLPFLDVDDNGATDALTDGLLVLRFLFGFRGESLTSGAVAPDCGRCGSADVEQYLGSLP